MKKISLQHAIAEIFFIFLGITLAIAFQNWNEQRKEAKLEKAVLQQLQIALQNDWEDVNDNINTHRRARGSCQNLLKALNDPNPINGQMIIGELIQAVDYTFLVSDVSTYEYLKSVGLHIIQNDTLRSQITKLYDVVYEGIYGVENNAKPVQRDLMTAVKKYYTSSATLPVARKNIMEIKNDDPLKFDLLSLQFSHRNMINRYQNNVLPELQKLIAMVEKEL